MQVHLNEPNWLCRLGKSTRAGYSTYCVKILDRPLMNVLNCLLNSWHGNVTRNVCKWSQAHCSIHKDDCKVTYPSTNLRCPLGTVPLRDDILSSFITVRSSTSFPCSKNSSTASCQTRNGVHPKVAAESRQKQGYQILVQDHPQHYNLSVRHGTTFWIRDL